MFREKSPQILGGKHRDKVWGTRARDVALLQPPPFKSLDAAGRTPFLPRLSFLIYTEKHFRGTQLLLSLKTIPWKVWNGLALYVRSHGEQQYLLQRARKKGNVGGSKLSLILMVCTRSTSCKRSRRTGFLDLFPESPTLALQPLPPQPDPRGSCARSAPTLTLSGGDSALPRRLPLGSASTQRGLLSAHLPQLQVLPWAPPDLPFLLP